MRTLSSEQTATLLHLNVKRVQGLARAGKLPAVRVGRKWLFPEDRIQRMLGQSSELPQRPTLELSARNRLRGEISRIHVEGLMAEVVLRVGDQELTAIITRSSVDRMGLHVGDEAFAVVKSTEVMIGKQGVGE